jgi:multiple sugar transport system substrate-binding protein
MSDEAFGDLIARLRSRKISRRRFMQDAAALGVSASLAGAVIQSMPAAAQSAKQVTFWTSHTEPDLTGLKMIVDAFNKANPDTVVKMVQVVGSETDTSKLMTAVRGGTGPDVYMLDRFTVAQRANEGVIQDLSSYLSKDSVDLKTRDISFAVEEATWDGKVYALPFDTDARAIYYNKTMLKDAGADPAELDSAKGPVTFDTLNGLATKVNKSAGNNFSQMGFVPWFDQGWHYTYGFAFGGNFFDEASCKVTPANDQVVAGHQYLYDYAKTLGAQKINAFIGNFMGSTPYPPQTHPFITKKLAMVLTGDWFIKNLKQYAPDIDYGITYIPIPKAGDKSVTWAGGWSLVIPQGAKEPDAAFKFMNFAAGPDGQKIYTVQTSHLPTVKALEADASLYDARHTFFVKDLLPTARNRPPLPVGALYWDSLTSAWQAIYLNQQEPKPALEGVVGKVQPQLQPSCPIKIGG